PAELGRPDRYTIVVRTAGDPQALLTDLARVVGGVDSRVKPRGLTTFEAAREGPLYPRRMLATAATVLGLVALTLAGIGLYGVVSASVGQRTREIGIRMALGARARDVQTNVLRDALVLAAIGAILGLAGGYALAGAMRGWLFGVTPFNAAAY